jgi:hypothetical protein
LLKAAWFSSCLKVTADGFLSFGLGFVVTFALGPFARAPFFGLGVGVLVGLGVGVAVALVVGVAVGLAVGLGVGLAVGLGVGVGGGVVVRLGADAAFFVFFAIIIPVRLNRIVLQIQVFALLCF